MIFAATFISTLIVIAIGLLIVGNSVGRASKTPDQVVFDVHEAIEFCAQALPDELTSKLSYDELRRSLRLHLEWIQAFHWTPENDSQRPILLTEEEPIAYMLERCEVLDLSLNVSEATKIVNAHNEYLIGIGALHTQSKEISELDLSRNPELNRSVD